MNNSHKNFIIEGSRVHDIASFYDEINRLFMQEENWQLGQSLDALDDLLYGGYGALQGAKTATIIWRNFEKCAIALGHETTRNFYLSKLAQSSTYNAERILRDLEELENGTGPTYFDIVLTIIADHPNITLVKD
ncbi:barstar family protein [Brucella sp. BE17]|uniref:barstar family protein n=1 Tax=Brucella sp. BE17 TaxID=3142977 RepID=UPI0031BA7415